MTIVGIEWNSGDGQEHAYMWEDGSGRPLPILPPGTIIFYELDNEETVVLKVRELVCYRHLRQGTNFYMLCDEKREVDDGETGL